MIEGNSAVVLNVMAIASIAFILTSTLVSLIVLLIDQKLLDVEVHSKRRLLWMLSILPWLVGPAVAFFFVQSSISPLAYSTHWHHIDSFAIASWHGITLLIMISMLCYLIINQFFELYRNKKSLNLLTSFSKNKIDYYEVDSSESYAFTAGFLNKRIYLSSGLISQASDKELRVILDHERAHVYNNDPFKKWLFGFLSSFFLPKSSQVLKVHMLLSMELNADLKSINNNTSTLFVARTLLKMARLNSKTSKAINPNLAANFATDMLEHRLIHLLEDHKYRKISMFISGFAFLLISTVCISSIDWIHHLMETLFKH